MSQNLINQVIRTRGAKINHGSHKTNTSFPHSNIFGRSVSQNDSVRGAGQMDYIVRKTKVNYNLSFHFQKQLKRKLSTDKIQDLCHTC